MDPANSDGSPVLMMGRNLGTSLQPYVTNGNHALKYESSTSTFSSSSTTIATSSTTMTTTTTSTTSSTTTTFPFIQNTTTPAANIEEHFCLQILYKDISDRVRIWDVSILIPNVLFMLFLLWRFKTAIVKLRNSNSPIYLVFYALVVVVVCISILRCIVAMTVNASMEAGDDADKILWLILRFFLLTTELSLVIFGFAFGHLDSRTSIQRVLMVTSAIALIYSTTQGVLEFHPPSNTIFNNHSKRDYDLFGHGGMEFWFTSSMFFFLVYTVITLLPYTRFRHRLPLPSKRSFYYYCGLLAVLNCLQALGSALLYYEYTSGLCIVDVTTYLYFSFFDPLVYGTFLEELFVSVSPSIPFSYRPQLDEAGEEDSVNIPCHGPQVRVYADDAGSGTGSYDSTHFDKQVGFNPSLNSVPTNVAATTVGATPSSLPVASSNINITSMMPHVSINSDYYQSYS